MSYKPTQTAKRSTRVSMQSTHKELAQNNLLSLPFEDLSIQSNSGSDMMSALPKDIQLCILDHIYNYRDLQTPCLVCRSWRKVAMPKLYRDMVLDLANQSRVDNFIASLKLGDEVAERKERLNDTRKLTLMGPILSRAHPVKPDAKPDQICTAAEIVLRSLPEHSLRTIRYFSDIPMSKTTCNTLIACQSKLQNVHIMISAQNTETLGLANLLARDLDTLDIYLIPNIENLDVLRSWYLPRSRPDAHTTTLLQNISLNLALSSQRTRRIYFEANSWAFPGPVIDLQNWDNLWDAQTARIEARKHRANQKLRELSLRGLRSMELLHYWLDNVDFSLLTSLTLWDLDNMTDFLPRLRDVYRGDKFNLLHLGIDGLNYLEDDGDGGAEDEALGDLLDMCYRLESLQLGWYHSSVYTLPSLSLKIPMLGETLRSLGLDMQPGITDFDIRDGEVSFTDYHRNLLVNRPAELERITRFCTKLQQFAFKMPSVEMVTSEQNDPADVIQDYCDALAHLKDLRTLHIRESPTTYVRDRVHKNMRRDHQHFADAVFRIVSSAAICPKLTAVIVGSEKGHETWEDEYRSYFVRQRRSLEADSKGVWSARLVPRDELRHECPLSDIVDFEPGNNELKRRVGRFHDD